MYYLVGRIFLSLGVLSAGMVPERPKSCIRLRDILILQISKILQKTEKDRTPEEVELLSKSGEIVKDVSIRYVIRSNYVLCNSVHSGTPGTASVIGRTATPETAVPSIFFTYQ